MCAKLVQRALPTHGTLLNDLLETAKTLISGRDGSGFLLYYIYFSVYGLVLSYLFLLALRSPLSLGF